MKWRFDIDVLPYFVAEIVFYNCEFWSLVQSMTNFMLFLPLYLCTCLCQWWETVWLTCPESMLCVPVCVAWGLRLSVPFLSFVRICISVGGCRDSPERFLCSDASGKYVPISFSWYVFVMLTYSIVGIFSICFFVKMKMFFSHDRFLFPFCSFLHLFVFVLSYTFAPGRTGPFRLSCLIFIDRFMLQYTYSILFSFFCWCVYVHV